MLENGELEWIPVGWKQNTVKDQVQISERSLDASSRKEQEGRAGATQRTWASYRCCQRHSKEEGLEPTNDMQATRIAGFLSVSPEH